MPISLGNQQQALGDGFRQRRLDRLLAGALHPLDGDLVKAGEARLHRAQCLLHRFGKTVALEASADERDTRGFISMTTSRPSAGLTANCTFEPPVSTPISRNTAIAALRISWYSLSVRVRAGATQTESPVWIPIGSRFSIEQTMMQLSARSRTTSISYSFQPRTDSSISTSCAGEALSPPRTISSNS